MLVIQAMSLRFPTIAFILGGCNLVIGVDDTEPRTLVAEIQAEGLEAPVELRLQSGSVDETITIAADGLIRFASRLAPGHVYTITLDGAPCALGDTASGVATADLVVELACAGATRLESLAYETLTGVQPVVAGGFDFSAAVSELQQVTRVTATTLSSRATLTIANEPASSGEPSADIPLVMGGNSITVIVDHPLSASLRSTYTLSLARATQLAHAYYGKTFPNNADNFDMLGHGLGTDGTRIIVGAVHDSTATDPSNLADVSRPSSGAAHIYVRQNGAWVYEDSLKAPNAEGTTLGVDGDLFGYSVAISGDYAVVGAPFEDSGSANQTDNSVSNAGAVYVFRRNGSAWVFDQYFKPAIPKVDGFFGWAVAIDGDTIAIGAYRQDDSFTGGGQVYVYRLVGSSWALEQSLGPRLDSGAGDGLGFAVAIQGNTIVASAISGHPTISSAGAIRIFTRTGTTWTVDAGGDFAPLDGFANDFAGASVAIDGSTIVVGVEMPTSVVTGTGAAYVLERGANGWGQVQRLVASNGNNGDEFGKTVTIAGDLIAIGAFREAGAGVGVCDPDSANGRPQSGAAYLYRRSGGTWTQARYIKSVAPDGDDTFGWEVRLARDFLVISAPGEDSRSAGNPNDNSGNINGAFYIYH